ncbi:hypothetical protein CsSME_00024204 [Camellia sinensis var. sinensis]
MDDPSHIPPTASERRHRALTNTSRGRGRGRGRGIGRGDDIVLEEARQILEEDVIDNGSGDDDDAADVNQAEEVLTGLFPGGPLDPSILKSFKAHIAVAIWEQKDSRSDMQDAERIDHALQIAHPIIEAGHDASVREPDRLYQAIERMTRVLQGQQIDEAGPSSIPLRTYNRRKRVDDR